MMPGVAEWTAFPRTEAVRKILRAARDTSIAADLLFLESWELHRPQDLGATLRAAQIRRANPGLVAEIQAELATPPSR